MSGVYEAAVKIRDNPQVLNAYKKVEQIATGVYQNTTAEDTSKESSLKKIEGFVKGSKAYYLHQGKDYILKFGKNTKLNVVSKAGKDSVFRLDKAHVGHHEFNHVNLNPKYSKITQTVTKSTGKVKVSPYDPHVKLPPGTLTAGTFAGKLCQTVNDANKILIPIAVTVDALRIGHAAVTDFKNGSTRNTVETSTNVASTWSSGYAGASIGSTVGSGILPGIGTIVGGIIGAVFGGISGSYASSYIEKVGDALDYDIVRSRCTRCGRELIARKYKGETINCNCKEQYTDTFQSFLLSYV